MTPTPPPRRRQLGLSALLRSCCGRAPCASKADAATATEAPPARRQSSIPRASSFSDSPRPPPPEPQDPRRSSDGDAQPALARALRPPPRRPPSPRPPRPPRPKVPDLRLGSTESLETWLGDKPEQA